MSNPAVSAVEPILLTERETARLLNISARSVFSLGVSGELPIVRIGASKRFRRTDVEAYIESRVAAARSSAANEEG